MTVAHGLPTLVSGSQPEQRAAVHILFPSASSECWRLPQAKDSSLSQDTSQGTYSEGTQEDLSGSQHHGSQLDT
jgi:hypothetical protein